ncbi:NAD(P)/FAD-dependent oxidoreductase [Nannocystis sp. ILAH1]|uniref:NAD(P)/FAD-dependent oxidoreductase n=1 Tax=unclassified Nannocystis TaxID=2627009 RepID=UPI00226F20C6|nr:MULTISPECIES: NAD(P)/FAD-dependent oxidoreductase [unclassified Nannocystis]MCY0991363.1 NAD(P)/FAD-dependent oxidoreductase [Nannocystis sp. ILAH1]MCY1066412.1 NAD(P)/FAD-dependent oxidoreductase [Nannocystis sp. RBIL2]
MNAGKAKKRVIIVGGGFGGLRVARGLAGADDLEITLLDRRNHHLFQPLLYQVAMAGLSPAEIAVPIRTVFSRQRNCRVILESAVGIDFENKKLKTTGLGDLDYDWLVLACGSRHSYFGHTEWEDYAPGLKSLEEATEIRRRVLTAFELAEKETDPAKQRRLLTFVVIGAGPTGVELAGALGEISRFTLSRDFRRIDPERARVILIEAGPRILPTFAEKLSDKATRDLESLGVTVWTNTMVTNVTAEGVVLGGESVQSATVLWAAGVAPSELNRSLGVELDRQGRILVETDCSIPGHREVFVIGDQAHLEEEPGKPPLPGLAPVAIQQGRHVARNILHELKGKPREPFRYLDKGQMATIGRRRAIAQFAGMEIAGFVAWLAWLLVHVYYLIGFKNRLQVMWEWTWSYIRFRRGARLIVNKEWHAPRAAPAKPAEPPPVLEPRPPPPATQAHA